MSWSDDCWSWTEDDDQGRTVCGPCAKARRIFGGEHHRPEDDN